MKLRVILTVLAVVAFVHGQRSTVRKDRQISRSSTSNNGKVTTSRPRVQSNNKGLSSPRYKPDKSASAGRYVPRPSGSKGQYVPQKSDVGKYVHKDVADKGYKGNNNKYVPTKHNSPPYKPYIDGSYPDKQYSDKNKQIPAVPYKPTSDKQIPPVPYKPTPDLKIPPVPYKPTPDRQLPAVPYQPNKDKQVPAVLNKNKPNQSEKDVTSKPESDPKGVSEKPTTEKETSSSLSVTEAPKEVTIVPITGTSRQTTTETPTPKVVYATVTPATLESNDMMCPSMLSTKSVQPQKENRMSQIVVDVKRANASGNYHYNYETENKIVAAEVARQLEMSDPEATRPKDAVGCYRYIAPDGNEYLVTYEAGVQGFVPKGAHLPTPPPTPELILRMLEYQKMKGIIQ